MKNFFNRTLFFIGWMLSPFTFWNDAFVNIPIAYIAANLLVNFIQARFVLLVLICYWASNVLGLAIMYVAGKGILRKGGGILKELLKITLTMAVYSLALITFSHIGLIRPIAGLVQ